MVSSLQQEEAELQFSAPPLSAVPRSALGKYVPYLGALLCMSARERLSSSSFPSTRRSTLSSQSRPRLSSASDSESVSGPAHSSALCSAPALTSDPCGRLASQT